MCSLLVLDPEKRVTTIAHVLAQLPPERLQKELQKCNSIFLNALLTLTHINDQLLFAVNQELLSAQRKELEILNASQIHQMEALDAQILANRETTQNLTQGNASIGKQLTHLQSIRDKNASDYQMLDSTMNTLAHDQQQHAQSLADIQRQQSEGLEKVDRINALHAAIHADLDRLERDLEDIDKQKKCAAQAEEEVWIEVKEEAKAVVKEVAALPNKAFHFLTDECASYIKKGLFLSATTAGGAITGNLLAKSAVTVITVAGGVGGLGIGIGCLVAYSEITKCCQPLSSNGERTSLV